MKPSVRYLIPITSAEDLRTSLQIKTQTISQISRSTAICYSYQKKYRANLSTIFEIELTES